MWYLTDRDTHMDSRTFGDLSLLLKTVFIDDPGLVSAIIDREFTDPDSELNSIVVLPFIGDGASIGQITASWAKDHGKWDELCWKLADAFQEIVLDNLADDFTIGDEQIFYLGTYAITTDSKII